ncbi:MULTISPECIES: TspO/MBR family protein [unclassified Mycolicibacterium]|uniref:TspO/MBR family protein n=1 Tax=unclassified Mycolicibacterium TaxID=2636767 RepID=UPI0012DC979B|nr:MULTISPECIES: TspO/MBR family protein [unclassified Mycolicibacterium]MUL81616.1 tryptophan-rich sensory protein [Mycolicibacterium sp. CBMA 329]MUL87382.1 tryptophan-rich sensory protein [Mycolicibacterium sp. CBMA 331]MUL99752.1 tryptophan-rich sensory protein [Mycolicibacterium sp. CBMA 334]MUM25338.1 tryptophan-rich sensory protein [Mycolicibacterium sp. CBMA 295]MUM37679.1 tryptophan-rich sensory protein [Mycolicibacterium sp. CBMA 247]
MRPITLAETATAALTTAFVGGLASRPAQSKWYESLRKPSFQPPRQAFPIVWPILYADIAVVSARTLDRLRAAGRQDEARAYTAALGVNLAVNAAWSWVFFSRRQLGAAAVTAAALTASSADLTRRAVAVQGAPGAVLAPYPLWCAFATALSARIWMLNRVS